jgi:hypothetical protein
MRFDESRGEDKVQARGVTGCGIFVAKPHTMEELKREEFSMEQWRVAGPFLPFQFSILSFSIRSVEDARTPKEPHPGACLSPCLRHPWAAHEFHSQTASEKARVRGREGRAGVVDGAASEVGASVEGPDG